MVRKKRLHLGIEIDAVFGVLESMSLIHLEHVFHRVAVLFQRGDNLLGIRVIDPRIIVALRDEQRGLDFVRGEVVNARAASRGLSRDYRRGDT